MSLPSSYSAILSDLNREVLRAQPSDPLQFCANWFASRLEQERTSARSAAAQQRLPVDESMKEATPPLVAGRQSSAQGESPASSSRAGPSSSSLSNKPKSSSLPFSQGYAFGTAGNAGARGSAPVGEQSPFSEYPPEGGPFARSGSGGGAPPPAGSRLSQQSNTPRGSGVGSGSGSTDADAPSSTSQQQQRFSRGGGGGAGQQQQQQQHQRAASTAHTESDEEVEDPRDDPNYHPGRAPAGGALGQFGQGGGNANGPSGGSGGSSSIPVTYNLGRRTSVSAESLDPNAATQSLPKTVIPKTASQRQRIEKAIANNLLFRNLDEDQYNDVVNAMKEVTVQAGTEVIVQGAVGDFFYVVEEGSFEVWVRAPPTHTYAGPGQSLVTQPGEEKKVATYGPGGSFGELALMYNAPRAATVVATSRATMWALDRVTFRSILVEHTSRKRRMYEQFLGEVSILQELNAKERAKIADALEEKIYDEGEAVVVEGEVGKNFYIIESGKAEVTKRRRNAHGGVDEDVIGVLGKGDYFGELALINSAPRAATVRAKPGEGRLRVATLGEKAFTRLLGPIIDILARKAERSYGPGAAVNANAGAAGAGAGQGQGQDKRESFGQGGGAFEGARRGIPVGGGDA